MASRASNRLAQRECRHRKRMRREERRQAAILDAQPWPLLDAYRKAQDKVAVIRASLET